MDGGATAGGRKAMKERRRRLVTLEPLLNGSVKKTLRK